MSLTSFTSVSFYLCLGIAVTLFYLTPPRFRVACLLVLSCAFYLASDPDHFALLVGSTVLVYVVARYLRAASTPKARAFWLGAGLVPALGSLVLFKAGKAVDGWLLPVGISYYTFKLISYLVETHRDRSHAEPPLYAFAAFSTFAAQMVSGPIQRPGEFLPQLAGVRAGQIDYEKIDSGIQLILGGLLFKLVIGDRLGAFIAIVDLRPESYSWGVVATSTLCYLLFLYADFAAYTNIAIGIGRLFGLESPLNFNKPFSASSTQEFWRRWHMSLTRWIGDYVFLPFAMATRDYETVGLVASLFVTMFLVGIWHGFTWTFALFGMMQGLFLSVSMLTVELRNRIFSRWQGLRPLRMAAGVLATFLLMTFSQIFFQANSVADAWTHVLLLSGLQPAGRLGFGDIRSDLVTPLGACMAISFYVGFGAPGLTRIKAWVESFTSNWVIYGVGLLLISVFRNETGSRFIYAQF